MSNISKTNEQLLLQSEALKKIHEHNRDYLSLTLTLPLGNKALKKVHTNQWLFTDLPKEFDLANWTVLADALQGSNVNRFEGYVKNRWYIEAVDISVDVSGKAEMKLTLNAFASSVSSFTDLAKDIQVAYADAVSNKDSKSSSKDKSKAVQTTKQKNDKLKSLEKKWGKWLPSWVDGIVKGETDKLAKAKKIYARFKSETYYEFYRNPKKTQGKVEKYESVYKKHHMNCADGANILCGAMECAGISSTIHHIRYDDLGHYTVEMKINGKSYWCDCSGSNGGKVNKPFNKVWGYKGGSNCGKILPY